MGKAGVKHTAAMVALIAAGLWLLLTVIGR